MTLGHYKLITLENPYLKIDSLILLSHFTSLMRTVIKLISTRSELSTIRIPSFGRFIDIFVFNLSGLFLFNCTMKVNQQNQVDILKDSIGNNFI